MSGGVDSSVAAKLLLDQGYEVVGFMMKLWSEDSKTPGKENACCDIKGVEDARRVANQLNIPFYLIDARAEFKKYVVDYFIEEYKNLRTPNPCVVCNEKIKFGWLLDFAEKAGCDFLATGHYARIEHDSATSNTQYPTSNQYPNDHLANGRLNEYWKLKNGKYRLLKAVDANKDQSYFLYNLNQEQLSKILFPIGEFTKPEVREMAKKWNLPVHEKKESQEICFIKEKDFREFLHRHIPKELFKEGDIVNKKGDVIGKHNGLINYTIGQRKNVSQELRIMNHEDKEPQYVVGYNIEKNRLIVGEDGETYRDKMVVANTHFIQKHELRVMNHGLSVKIRYRHPAVPCSLITRNSLLVTQFDQSQRAITPGQSAVFYSGDEVLGGGIIKN